MDTGMNTNEVRTLKDAVNQGLVPKELTKKEIFQAMCALLIGEVSDISRNSFHAKPMTNAFASLSC
jgi:hypothetical protein